MSVRRVDTFRVECDRASCREHIDILARDTEHVRSLLRHHRWFMSEEGKLIKDAESPATCIGFDTFCPAHRERR
jgi:hypothetical protein